MAEEAVADPPSQNGSGPRAASVEALRERIAGAGRQVRGIAGGLAESVARAVVDRVPRADLDDRDPDYIRENLPMAWLLATLWFRGEVRHLGNVPERGPVLLVGNHSGGIMSPDTIIFTLAFNTFFGVERPFYQLAHNLVTMHPLGQLILKRYGTVSASHDNARTILRQGGAVLVYPGGDREVFRPSWRANRIDFAGRKGFVRLALEQGVPIVPVVSIGGQETALFLGPGGSLARALRLDRMLRLKSLPVIVSLPFGLQVGGFAGHLPLPAKITIEVLPPIDPAQEFGPDPDPDDIYRLVTTTMQDALDGLAAERRRPILG